MHEQKTEQLRRQFMWDHDAEPDKLRGVLDELRALQAAPDDSQEALRRYRKASAEVIDFFDRLHDLAISEAVNNGELIDFSDSTVSQIILACVRGYPDYRHAFEGTNSLLNEEMETSRKLGQQINEVAEHYERIIEGPGLEE